VDQIARQAKVNKALIYYYFRGKKRLFMAVLDDLFSALLAVVESGAKAPGSAEKRLFSMIGAYFDFVNSRRTYPHIVQREMIGGGKFLEAMAQHIRPLHELGKRVIAEGIQEGHFEKVDPGQFLFSVVALIAFYFSAAKLFGLVTKTDALSPARLALRRREILELLRRGILVAGQG
jgi:TetR/AcrR family transcriptional regulator